MNQAIVGALLLAVSGCVDNLGLEQGGMVIEGFLPVEPPNCVADPGATVFVSGGAIDISLAREYTAAVKITNERPAPPLNVDRGNNYPNYGSAQNTARINLESTILEITGSTVEPEGDFGGEFIDCALGVCTIIANAVGVSGDSDANGQPELVVPAGGTIDAEQSLGAFVTLLPAALAPDLVDAQSDVGGLNLTVRVRAVGRNDTGSRVRSPPILFPIFTVDAGGLPSCPAGQQASFCFLGQDRPLCE